MVRLWYRFRRHLKRQNDIISRFNRRQWRIYWWLIASIELIAAVGVAYLPWDFAPFRGTLILLAAFFSGMHYTIGMMPHGNNLDN